MRRRLLPLFRACFEGTASSPEPHRCIRLSTSFLESFFSNNTTTTTVPFVPTLVDNFERLRNRTTHGGTEMAAPGAPAFLEQTGEQFYDLSFLVVANESTPAMGVAWGVAREALKRSPVHDFDALQRHLEQVQAELGVELTLDASQQLAFCAAMTREVVLIQG
jgi:hypothetical protein